MTEIEIAKGTGTGAGIVSTTATAAAATSVAFEMGIPTVAKDLHWERTAQENTSGKVTIVGICIATIMVLVIATTMMTEEEEERSPHP